MKQSCISYFPLTWLFLPGQEVSNIKCQNLWNNESDMVRWSAQKQEMAMDRTSFETGTKRLTKANKQMETERNEEKRKTKIHLAANNGEESWEMFENDELRTEAYEENSPMPFTSVGLEGNDDDNKKYSFSKNLTCVCSKSINFSWNWLSFFDKIRVINVLFNLKHLFHHPNFITVTLTAAFSSKLFRQFKENSFFYSITIGNGLWCSVFFKNIFYSLNSLYFFLKKFPFS